MDKKQFLPGAAKGDQVVLLFADDLRTLQMCWERVDGQTFQEFGFGVPERLMYDILIVGHFYNHVITATAPFCSETRQRRENPKKVCLKATLTDHCC